MDRIRVENLDAALGSVPVSTVCHPLDFGLAGRQLWAASSALLVIGGVQVFLGLYSARSESDIRAVCVSAPREFVRFT
jgi:hypothetical protein